MAEVSIKLITKEDGSIEVVRLGEKLDTVGEKGEASAKKTATSWAKAAKSIGKASTRIGKNLSLKVTAPLLLMGVLATNTAIKYETAFTGVRKTVEATEQQFAALERGFMSLARVIPVETEELFGIGEAAGQLGIKQENILAFTRVMADLGVTTNLASTEAATSLARFGNITGLASKDYERLGSTIVALGNDLETTEREIVDMGLRLAGAGDTVGLTQAQILSLSGALSSVGLQAEAGGTAFSRVMKEIDKEAGTSSQAISRFAEISGMSVAAFEKQWKENAAGALLNFIDGLAKIRKAGANVNIVLDELAFGDIRVSDALLRASGAAEKFHKALNLGTAAWGENIALAEEAALRYGTAASQLQIAKNRVSQLAASFGEVLAPALIAIIDFMQPVVDWLTELSPTAKTVIVVVAALAAAIGPLLLALGMVVTGVVALTAVSAPLLLTIGVVALAVIGLGVAAHQLIKNWEPIKKFFVDLWAAVVGTFNTALATIKEKTSQWYEVGRNLIMGMVEGIISATQWIVDAAVGAANAAVSAVTSALGISSPSAVFAEFGKQMMAGMAEGITGAMAMPQLALATATPGAPGGPFAGNMLPNTDKGIPASQNTQSYDQRQSIVVEQGAIVVNNYSPDLDAGALADNLIEEISRRADRSARF